MKKLVLGAFIALALGTLSFTTRFGLDTFDIYLNNTRVLHQAVNQPLNLRVLSLDKAKESDRLRFVYRHCRLNNGEGSGRHIALEDESGKVLRKWDFADATPMAIPVKELLQTQKQNSTHQLSLYYAAHELDKDALLSVVRFK